MKRLIVIIDDHQANLMILKSIVSEIPGCEPVTFDVSEEALKWCADNDPAVVLVDHRMPPPNGIEFIARFRKMDGKSETPIVMVTGQTDRELRYEALMTGATDFLNKPIDKTELLARVRNLLELSVSRHQMADRAAWLAAEVRKATGEIADREQETARLNKAYRRFVPHEFLRLLDKESVIDVAWSDQTQRELTIFVTDIRSFTTLSESLTPEQTFNFLNSYLRRVGPIIRDNHGFIDKYIGDGVMALFGSSDGALRAAIGLHDEVRLYNRHRAGSGYPPIAIGIALHRGNLMLGTIGESERMDTTVIGDAVNVCFRLEGLTRESGALALISDPSIATLERPQDFHFRRLGSVAVKGRRDPVAISEICDCDPPEIRTLKVQTLSQFDAGVQAFADGELREAAWAFQNVLSVNPGDLPAQSFLARCQGDQSSFGRRVHVGFV